MDIADLADARIEQALSEAVRRSTQAVAQKGTVFCDDCGDVIPLDRSRALPSATRCVGCQFKAERSLAGR